MSIYACSKTSNDVQGRDMSSTESAIEEVEDVDIRHATISWGKSVFFHENPYQSVSRHARISWGKSVFFQ